MSNMTPYISGWTDFDDSIALADCPELGEYNQTKWREGWKDAYALFLQTMEATDEWCWFGIEHRDIYVH